ncbi:hypothetical protein [Paracoccus sp. ME4]|uniref:hypothetical protein n=1 Tax=Paracoccus sp. ME4 TaxID=3138066 RepID=UPI00398B3977
MIRFCGTKTGNVEEALMGTINDGQGTIDIGLRLPRHVPPLTATETLAFHRFGCRICAGHSGHGNADKNSCISQTNCLRRSQSFLSGIL